MSTARKEGESFEEYKTRRKAENAEHETRKRMGWWFHKGGTYNRAEEEKKKVINRGLFILAMHGFSCILNHPLVAPPVAE